MRLVRDEFIEDFHKNGVPKSVLYSNYPEDIKRFIGIIEVPKAEGTTIIDKRKQQNAINTFKKLKNCPFMLISARNYDYLPSQLALEIAVHAIEQLGKNFYWHVINGSTTDRLRDDPVVAEDIKKTNLLILSGVAANSTTMKIDKLRDLLTEFSHIPRIVSVAGTEPLNFAREILHIKPEVFVQF